LVHNIINMPNETSLNMVLHAFIVAIVVYLVLVYAMKKPNEPSIDKAVLVGGIALVYMTIFGHKLPSTAGINPNLKM